MPSIWDKDISKVGVTVAELVPDWWPSYEALHKKIKREANFDYGIRRLQRGCKSCEMMIDFDTLAREIQEALGDPRKCSRIMEKWFRWDGEAVRFFNDFTFESGGYLSDKHKNEFILNASVLKAVHTYKEEHIIEKSKKNRKATGLYGFMAREATLFQEVLKVKHGGIQHTLPSTDRNFRIVYDKFFQKTNYNGKDYDYAYAELVDGRLKNENAKVVNNKIENLLNSLFGKAGGKPSKIQVARRYQAFTEGLIDVVNLETGEQYNPADFETLSDRTITKWLSKWQNRIATHHLRSSDRPKLRTAYITPTDMDRPTFAGSLISVDDRQPPFEYAPTKRLWLYNALDVASDAITATVYGETKEGMILDFYRQILRNYTQWGVSLPLELEAEKSLNSSFVDTFLKEGAMFDWVRLEPNNPRGKRIENTNKQFRYGVEKEHAGWKGRPFAKDEANQALANDGEYAEKRYVPYDQLVQQSLIDIEDWNNSPHPVKPEMSRWDYFMAHQNPNLHPTNWKAILPHLGYKQPTSCNVGRFRLQGLNMMIGDNGSILAGAPLIERLKTVEGQDVTAYWLDSNDGGILKALIYIDDTYICEAIPTPKFNRARSERNQEDDINLQLQQKYIATVEGFLKERKGTIDAVLVDDQRPTTINRNFEMPGLTRINNPDTDWNQEAQTIEDPEPEVEEYITNNSLLNKF